MRPWRAITLRAHAIFRARPRVVIASCAIAAVCVLGALGWWRFRAHALERTPVPALVDAKPRLVPAAKPAPRPTRVVTFAEGCVTSECHATRAATPTLHAPVAAGACATCHKPDTGGHVYPLVRDKGEICSSCHDTRWHTPVQHAAMTDNACLACHDPHAATTNDLLRATSVRATCSECHPRSEGLVVHAPYADDRCELCHNSHGSDRRGLLRTSSVAANCAECHPGTTRKTEQSTHSHAKVEHSCLSCHSPHTAPDKGLLVAPSRDLCVSCHADVGTQVAGATVSHDAVLKGEQCVRCHDPHGTDRVGMLRDEQGAVCLSCHDTKQTAADGRTIPAMGELVNPQGLHGGDEHNIRGHRECTGCHSVHGGNHTRLLRAVNEKVPLGAYEARNYALCFSCHDPALASSAAATQFRDGDRNLHEVHLKPSDNKSRGCATCHSVHAVGEPRLIAKAVNFEGSGWAMPMNFKLTPDGGSCGSGCHEPLEYSRKPGGARSKGKGGAP